VKYAFASVMLISPFTEDITPEKGEASTKPDIATGTPAIHGDWVLFHPVYTPEELRAVKVRGHNCLGQ
jgi:hypothetical protein